MPAERSVVKSLDRALSILDALIFAQSDLELREIAGSTKLPKSTVYRLLWTLEARGYVTRDAVTGSYRLSALKMSRYLGSLRRIQDVLSHLALRSGETANLGVLTGSEITYVARADSPHALRWQLGVGSRVPAHCSALGKAILAHSPPDTVERVLSVSPARQTQRTIVDRAEFIRELERVRLRDYALDDEEFMDGVRCVAVPVRESGQVIGAVSLAGPAFRFTQPSAVAQVPGLMAAAAEIATVVDPRARAAAVLLEAQ